MAENYIYSEIYKKFGAVTRARNCFLYTKKGVRLTDLYQENGRAILGWSESSNKLNSFTMFKNVMNRGLNGTFYTEYENRLSKAVSELLNSERSVLIYNSYSDAVKNAIQISADGVNFYRPWNNAFCQIDFALCDVVVIVPPLPWSDDIFLVAAKNKLLKNALSNGKNIQPSKRIIAPLNVAVTRSIYNLIFALQERKESDWFIYDKVITKYWLRKGPYLYPKMAQKDYTNFALHCLNCNLVINPDFNNPSIVPFGADFGVFTKLKNNPFEFTNKS